MNLIKTKIKSIMIKNVDTKILKKILKKELTVFEDIQGSKIYVNYNSGNFTIKAKTLTSDPINLIDLATQKYYNKCINFFYSLPDRVTSLLPKKFWFCFEYFPDTQPANIEYDRLPKNNLILSGIVKKGKFNFSPQELIEYSNLFDTDYLPIIFKGKLDSNQVEAIKYFLNTSEEDLEYVFGEKNFAYFFYKLLNPLYENSFLMNSFNDNLEKICIRVEDSTDTFQILNPLYNRISKTNNTEYSEIYSLILLNFLDFLQLVELDKIKVKGNTKDEIYINLISTLFNIYMKDTEEDINKFHIVIPEFFNKDKFKINYELISNNLTKDYIQKDPKFEYIFKCILGSFNKKRKKPIGIFTEKTVSLFNKMVQNFEDYIDNIFNKISDTKIRKMGLVDFEDYYDLKYSTDAEGKVYPEMYDEFEVPSALDKKKKK